MLWNRKIFFEHWVIGTLQQLWVSFLCWGGSNFKMGLPKIWRIGRCPNSSNFVCHSQEILLQLNQLHIWNLHDSRIKMMYNMSLSFSSFVFSILSKFGVFSFLGYCGLKLNQYSATSPDSFALDDTATATSINVSRVSVNLY